MSCGRFRPALRDLALGQAASSALDRHLASCEPCRRQIEEDRRLAARIDGEIEEALAVEVSPDFVARVREGLAGGQANPPWAGRWWMPVALGAGVLVLAFFLGGRAPRPSVPVPFTVPAAPPESEARDRPRTTPRPAGVVGAARAPALPVGSRSPAPTVAAGPSQRIVPEVLIPPRDVEATRRFLAGRHRWRLLQGTPLAREVETLESPAVVDWKLESRRAQGFTAPVLDSWPLMPSD
jgi:hypothetical protein